MDTPEKLRRLLSAAGFSSAEIWRAEAEYRFTVDTLLSVQTSCGVPMRRLVWLPPDAQAARRSRVRHALERMTPEELV